MSNCNKCGREIKWTKRLVGGSERNIPLELDGSDHTEKVNGVWVCKGTRTMEAQQTLPLQTQQKAEKAENVVVSPEFDISRELRIHEKASFICLKLYGGLYESADSNRKMMMEMHWENIVKDSEK